MDRQANKQMIDRMKFTEQGNEETSEVQLAFLHIYWRKEYIMDIYNT